MSRRAIAGFACFVVFVALISAARADHDPTAPFAGAWGLGPRGELGQLKISRVDDAVGRALLAQLGGALPRSEPADFYRGRLATAADGGPVAGCASRRAAARLDGVYMDEALASLGPPAGLQVQIRRGEGPRATLRWTSPAEAGVVRHAPLVFLGHVAGDGADPVVTLRRLRIAVAHRPGDATATIVGTFRGRATRAAVIPAPARRRRRGDLPPPGRAGPAGAGRGGNHRRAQRRRLPQGRRDRHAHRRPRGDRRGRRLPPRRLPLHGPPGERHRGAALDLPGPVGPDAAASPRRLPAPARPDRVKLHDDPAPLLAPDGSGGRADPPLLPSGP